MTETIAVVGGTGTLGAPLVEALLERGVSVRVLSRTAAKLPVGAEHRRIDLTSGEGLAAALAGASAVIDAANSTRGADQTLVEGTRRLLEADAAAGVGHHLTISIVGCDLVPVSYYRHKVAQEGTLEASPLPWTLLRATQFHQLLDRALTTSARFGIRPTGAAKLQPIDPTVVAARLADAALAPPAGRLPDLAGPQVATLSELGRTWATARGRHRLPLRVPSWGKIGRGLAVGALCDPAAAAPGKNFEEWLRHE